MHGMTKNIRRQGIPASKNGIPNPEYIEIHGCPTAERLSKSAGDFTLGGEDRGIKTYIMRDSPLDRAHKKGIISGAEHSALQKYRHHWYHAGQAPTISSLDLDRIFSGGDGGPAGMPKSEGQVFHRQRWREAQQCLGDRTRGIVDSVVCNGWSLEISGYSLGYASQRGAITKAGDLLREGGGILAKHWGIG